MDRVGAAVVGGGAVGAAVAWQLADAGVPDVFLLEKNPTLGEEQSGRSSCVVHAGIYYAEGSLKARLCVAANAGMYEFCARHGVPCERTGKLVVAPAREDVPAMEEVLRRARAAGVPGIEALTRRQVTDLEPNLSVEAALLVPSTGIVDAPALVHTLARLSEEKGATVLPGFEVVRIEARGGVFEVTGRRAGGAEESFEAEMLVNSAGLQCDVVGRMVDPGLDVRVVPMRGEYVKMSRSRRPDLWLSGRNVYPVPEPLDLGDDRTTVVGAHLTPTFGLGPGGTVVSDQFTVGPEFVRAPSRYDYETGRRPASHIVSRAARYMPSLTVDDVTLDYAGIMVHLAGVSDWIVRRAERHPNCIQLLGIESPGLTCCIELAKVVRGMLAG
jgi:L-2-hydroxyglutarate oxidase LhgO